MAPGPWLGMHFAALLAIWPGDAYLRFARSNKPSPSVNVRRLGVVCSSQLPTYDKTYLQRIRLTVC
jgi:hypothetical protein